MKDQFEFTLSPTVANGLLKAIDSAVGCIDSEYPGHFDKLDPFIHLIKRRLDGDNRSELEILLEGREN